MIKLLQNGWIYDLEFQSAGGVYAVFLLSLLGPCLLGYLCGSLCARFLPTGKSDRTLPFVFNVLIFALCISLCAPLVGFQYVAGISVNPILYAAALCMMLGQIFPAFLHFKGTDTGIVALFASMLVLCPMVLGILVLCCALILLATRYTALSFVICGLLFPLVLSGCYRFFFSASPNAIVILITILMGLLIAMTYRRRLSAIMRGEEPKIKLKRAPRE